MKESLSAYLSSFKDVSLGVRPIIKEVAEEIYYNIPELRHDYVNAINKEPNTSVKEEIAYIFGKLTYNPAILKDTIEIMNDCGGLMSFNMAGLINNVINENPNKLEYLIGKFSDKNKSLPSIKELEALKYYYDVIPAMILVDIYNLNFIKFLWEAYLHKHNGAKGGLVDLVSKMAREQEDFVEPTFELAEAQT